MYMPGVRCPNTCETLYTPSQILFILDEKIKPDYTTFLGDGEVITILYIYIYYIYRIMTAEKGEYLSVCFSSMCVSVSFHWRDPGVQRNVPPFSPGCSSGFNGSLFSSDD